MIDIFVIRGAGDRPGDDVVDPLIGGSLPVALARGRAELDERGQRMKDESLECVYRNGLRVGQLVRVNDSERGSFAAKIVGITHRTTAGSTTTTLELRRASS